MKVTAVLVTWWKRDVSIALDNLRQLSCFDDIIVHHNTPQHDMKMFGRYLMAQQAKTELIYTQDDDCLVNGIEGLIKDHKSNNLYGATHYLPQWFYDNWLPRWKPCNLFGWGVVWHKQLLNVFANYLSHYPQDKLFLREADYVFSGLIPNELTRTIISEHTNLPCATDSSAAYRCPETWPNLEEIVKRIRLLKSTNTNTNSNA